MSTELMHSASHPSTSHQQTGSINGLKRRTLSDEFNLLPLSDPNSWYYPSQGHDSEEEDLPISSKGGNGDKMRRGARWLRRGKIAPWGPGMDDWEAEERARKRVKLLLPHDQHSPSPPSLPHLRSPSPPLISPYPPPTTQHFNYSSFVLDKAVTHTFRSTLLDELELATNGLIEGEATMRRALGRLWQVVGEDPERRLGNTSLVPKREDGDEEPEERDETARRIARAPDLTPPIHKLFLLSYSNGGPPVFEPSHFASPEMQLDTLEKSLATLRELQDDGREYVERLQEIREGLGEVRAQRNSVWDMVRERAIKELQEVAFNTVM